MCARYVLHGPVSRYQTHFDAQALADWAPSYNVAPSAVMPVVCQGPEHRELIVAKWGLIPSWCTDPAESPQPINAKAETAAIKPMFRQSFRSRRVLVPADGFYEWKPVEGRRKQPYLIRQADGSPMGMAGLLECWRAPNGELVWTFVVLTTGANPLVAPIHSRMPAIIAPESYSRWLDPALSDVEALHGMLAPYPDRLMEAFPVSNRVGTVANDDPDLIKPEAEQPGGQLTLDGLI